MLVLNWSQNCKVQELRQGKGTWSWTSRKLRRNFLSAWLRQSPCARGTPSHPPFGFGSQLESAGQNKGASCFEGRVCWVQRGSHKESHHGGVPSSWPLSIYQARTNLSLPEAMGKMQLHGLTSSFFQGFSNQSGKKKRAPPERVGDWHQLWALLFSLSRPERPWENMFGRKSKAEQRHLAFQTTWGCSNYMVEHRTSIPNSVFCSWRSIFFGPRTQIQGTLLCFFVVFFFLGGGCGTMGGSLTGHFWMFEHPRATAVPAAPVRISPSAQHHIRCGTARHREKPCANPL